ncbi:Leuk-A4-hydro-C domain-containing protein [Aphelenchoides besseyi]|nr:Leuk-A4-hydro-C domain-containing protein [Aphelenchoides besseyi]
MSLLFTFRISKVSTFPILFRALQRSSVTLVSSVHTTSRRMNRDPSTCANYDKLTIKHIHLDWNVNFEKKLIEGKTILDIEAVQSTDRVLLDIRDVEVSAVQFKGSSVEYKIEDNGALGQKLSIQLANQLQKGDKEKLHLTYTTSKNGATALQFMEKELTADKKAPYLYSQCQAIHARSIVPCMDTPAIKQTYSAEVSVPSGLVCLMSGLADGSETRGDRTVFRFNQPVEIPSYLIAIVVGAMESRDISARCRVWAEASVVEKAHDEFRDTELMLQAAEGLMGDYEWHRYDLVVLPPSFPFGGMENPCLTFVTPTIIAGDRSLANVIAHEIAHSYTGNLVTNANWEHFWLNEGFTVFVERKILGRLYGEKERDFASITGWDDELLKCINETFSPVHEYTKMIPRLGNNDPDDAFSVLPYEKGSAFLLYLEQELGSKERFEEMLKAYIKKYRRQSIVTDDWIDFLKSFFVDKKQVLDNVDFDSWLHKPGVPPNKPKYDQSLVAECIQLAERWSSADLESLGKEDAEQFRKMSTSEKVKVLDTIEAGPPLSHDKVALLGKAYGLNESGNAEIVSAFIFIGLKAQWQPMIPKALEFVTAVGRMKYLRPIYKKLFNWPESRELAVQTFEKNRPFMHPITVHTVKAQL